VILTVFGIHKRQFWNTSKRSTTVNSAIYSEVCSACMTCHSTKNISSEGV
jgi:hypothetical protein